MKPTRGNPLPGSLKGNRLMPFQHGHTLAEVMIAMAVLGFMIVSLYAAFSSGFAVLRVARENLRATQILEERMEVLRLIRFDDALPGFIPTNFTAAFYINNTNSMIAGGFDYTGRVSILKSPVTESYAADLRMVRIDLTWKSGNVVRTREMTTFISKYGLQNYIY
jgi:prepilin-type N-terminal cleavage/methylation domain-containing protein